MKDDALVEKLLYIGEGAAIDYKLQQYNLEKSDNKKKSAFIKDILAFANAWRSETAYIIIGIRDGSKEIVGLDKEIDESRFQQLVNEKEINSPIVFSYRTLEYQGTKLGLFEIPVQERPFYLRKDFGDIKANTVYVRRGSSTAIANPTEIAKMGKEYSNTSKPNLIIRLISLDQESLIMDSLKKEFIKYTYDVNDIDDYIVNANSSTMFHISRLTDTNIDYYREIAKYIKEYFYHIGFKIEIEKKGNTFADDVKIIMIFNDMSDDFRLVEENEFLETPSKSNKSLPTVLKNMRIYNKNLQIENEGNYKKSTFLIKKVHAGESVFSENLFLLYPPETLKEVKVFIYANQLDAPIEHTIPIVFKVDERKLTMENVKKTFNSNK